MEGVGLRVNLGGDLVVIWVVILIKKDCECVVSEMM